MQVFKGTTVYFGNIADHDKLFVSLKNCATLEFTEDGNQVPVPKPDILLNVSTILWIRKVIQHNISLAFL